MATAIGAVAVAECQKNGADAALMVQMPPRDADSRTLAVSGGKALGGGYLRRNRGITLDF